jgi:ATP-dependent exoDNAse (exonuclease V) beta subunit
MSAPRHEMILASAGSGKTYALTNRYVALLAGGAAPERIVALTFTRKAAGEFFDEILRKLAGAASDPVKAAKLAGDIGRPGLGPADFLALLRRVVETMHRLRLGTLDSFFAQIVGAFPFELGLAGRFEVLEEAAARAEQRRASRRLFTRAGALTEAQQEFVEAFKRATFGREEKRLGEMLENFLREHQQTYLDAPDPARWGEPARIWPEGNEWLEGRADAKRAVKTLGSWLAAATPPEKQRERWEDFLAAAEEWTPGASLPRELAYVLEKALAAWPELRRGATTLEFDKKKQELDAAAAAALAELARVIVGGELRRRLEMTRGVFAVVRGHERHYDEAVRRAGRLTFADVQRLLAPGAGAPLLAQTAGEGRLLIDYRLDAAIDHWLLDEFQDTSQGQWSALKNLVDEAVQDPTGGRSFFCVGDVKQAIYQWREGDPDLFREIFKHYTAAAPGAIAERPLVESWRSGPPLIAMVNAVFGAGEELARLFPGPASARWNEEWREHRTALPGRTGQAALLHAADEEARWRAALRLLREIRPLERGLTCAVLVRRNEKAAALADFLRREGGLPAVAESDLKVCADNPLGAALLALAQAAAHPGDTLAWEHVRMTPLGAVLRREGLERREQFTARVLGQIHAEGFERTARWWLARLEPGGLRDDAFTRSRARQFAAAAAEFDATGRRDVAEFVEFMRGHLVRDAEGASVVRVMTVHKAKGLGFDVVIVPDLEGRTIEERRKGLAVRKSAQHEVEWVLDLPPEIFCRADATLAKQVAEAKAAGCYENLCVLYVALTRAKRGLYVVTEPPGKSASTNFPRLLADTLGGETRDVRVGGVTLPGAWSAGEADWFAKLQPAEPAEVEPALAPLEEGTRAPRWAARRPSGESAAGTDVARIFSLERSSAADFGAAVHRLLAGVEWGPAVGSEDPWALSQEPREAVAEARAVLRATALAAVWTRPAGLCEIWRERAFEMLLDGVWLSGAMDRVVVERNPDGQAVRATVYDFKTDRVDENDLTQAATRHAGQMALYRRAVARLTGLAEKAIEARLVFTRIRRIVEAPISG